MTTSQHGQPITKETLPWKRDPDQLSLIPKSRRRRITSTYEAAIPSQLASIEIDIPKQLCDDMRMLSFDIIRFDATQQGRTYHIPALLLRSESSASSQIEHLTSSARNIALAELSTSAPQNAKLIAGNIAAMKRAVALPRIASAQNICSVHKALIDPSGESFGGEFRSEQVWIGGTPYSPHGATFVPPHWNRVPACIDDLIAFSHRDDMDPIAKAAIFHAQFETIHPFIDGNGRTGRALLHCLLRADGLLEHATLPLSAGLLHDIDPYMNAIDAYQAGDFLPIVSQLCHALELALSIGELTTQRIDTVLNEWFERITERKGASIHKLPALLVEQPVIDAAHLATALAITPRAATNLVSRACEYGILRRIGNAHRGVFYQADDIIEILDDISDIKRIRRMFPTA